MIPNDDDDTSTLSLTDDQAKCLIRVHPYDDATNGFFVACLQRKLINTTCKLYVVPTLSIPKGYELCDNNPFDCRKEEETLAMKKEERSNRNEPSKASGTKPIVSNGKRGAKNISIASDGDDSNSGLSKKRRKKIGMEASPAVEQGGSFETKERIKISRQLVS